jgi:hypothetical protein
MALMRIRRGAETSCMDKDSIREFYTCGCIDQAREINNDILEYLGRDIPESESEYMLVNMAPEVITVFPVQRREKRG